MTTTEQVCGLCRLPESDPDGQLFSGNQTDGIPLHLGQRTQIVGWQHQDGDCLPILTTCYRAWVVYGRRP